MKRLFSKKWQWCFLLLLAVSILQQPYAMAQTQSFKGTVVDNQGMPLPGVNVSIKGTKVGMTTNNDGRFVLVSPTASSTLVFTFVGFQVLERAVTTGEEVKVTLLEDNQQLGEVVVVGYGKQKKVNLTGSVSIISGKMLTERPVASASLALQGNAPGVTIRQQSGVPGGDGGGISIRGIGSISAGSNPLVLVDNVEMSLDAIDPSSIESISVLKDAAASSIYGSRAANGVILVTTKRGGTGVKVNFNSTFTKQEAVDLPDKVNALEHMQYWDVAQANSGLPLTFTNQIAAYKEFGADNFSRFDTDWKALVLTNNGLMHNHNLNISAGTEKIKVFASGAFLDQNGLTANTNYKRTDLRFNTDVTLASNLTASMDLVLNKTDRNWPGNGTPTSIMRYMLGLPAIAPGRFDTGEWGEGWSNNNPAAQAEDGGFNNVVGDSRIISGTLNYKPIKDLELVANYSSNAFLARTRIMQGQYDIYNADVANNKLVFARAWPLNNSITDNMAQTNRDLFRVQATYSKSLGDHNFKVLGGFSTEKFSTSGVNGSRINVISEDFPYLNAGESVGVNATGGISEFNMASAFGRVNYDYKEKYLLEVNGRFDASSRFIKENWWKLFPSVSAGWRISQEDFWSDISNVVSEAKLRASYGTLGNQNLSSYYPTYPTYTTNSGTAYYFGNVVNSGYALTTASNPLIQWETSKVLNIGLDLSLLKNRLSVTADYFRRDITDMLTPDLIPKYVGLNPPFINIGAMRNSGWELGLTWKDKISDFSYQITGNVSDVKNEIIDIAGKDYIAGSRITREGYAHESYYGYKADGLFQSQAEIDAAPFHYATTKPGDIRYVDINGDKKIDANDRAVLGNFFPRYEYSLNLATQFKGFDFTAFFQGVGKMDNYLSGTGTQPFFSTSFQGSMYKHQADFWSPTNTGAAYPRLTANSNTNNYQTSSFWMRDASYLRLKNVVLGYTLPKTVTDKVKIGSARLYVSGQNMITWSNYFPGFDPEQRDTGGEFYPIMTTYTVGLNVNF